MRHASRTIGADSRLFEETHEHQDRALVRALEAVPGARREPLVMSFPIQPIDPTISASELLAIITRLYRELPSWNAHGQSVPRLAAEIKCYADRHWQITGA